MEPKKRNLILHLLYKEQVDTVPDERTVRFTLVTEVIRNCQVWRSLVPVVKPETVLENDNEGVGYQTKYGDGSKLKENYNIYLAVVGVMWPKINNLLSYLQYRQNSQHTGILNDFQKYFNRDFKVLSLVFVTTWV